jgi:hypothetical protein
VEIVLVAVFAHYADIRAQVIRRRFLISRNCKLVVPPGFLEDANELSFKLVVPTRVAN